MNRQDFEAAFGIVSTQPIPDNHLSSSLVRILEAELQGDLSDIWYISDRVEIWADWQDADFTIEQCVDLAIKYKTLKSL